MVCIFKPKTVPLLKNKTYMTFTYQNQVFLKGQVGDDIVFRTSKNGKDYCTFSLIVNCTNKWLSDEETNSVEFIRIFIFNNQRKKMVDKLKEMGLRRGQFVSIIGRLQTSKTEHKGINILNLTVQVLDLSILQTGINKQKKDERT